MYFTLGDLSSLSCGSSCDLSWHIDRLRERQRRVDALKNDIDFKWQSAGRYAS
jgi:hypothetical protein